MSSHGVAAVTPRPRAGRTGRGLVQALLAGAVALALGACASLPDVRPFASATLALEKSVDESFAAGARAQRQVAELLTVDPQLPIATSLEGKRKEYEALAKSIEADGVHRTELMRALTDYTDSLAAVVEASNNAQGNVDALADSVLDLAGTFSASPLRAVAAPAADLAKVALREAVRIKASKDLRSGLEAADHVVQQAGRILLADLQDLQKSVATKDKAVSAAIRLAGGEPLRYRERLEARRAVLVQRIVALSSDAAIESLTPSAELQLVEQQLAACDAWYVPLATRRDGALSELRATEQLYAKVQEAIVQWTKAHADLVAAAREGRTINLRRLVEVVVEVKGIVERIEKEADDGGR
jgi:hypothetical protein